MVISYGFLFHYYRNPVYMAIACSSMLGTYILTSISRRQCGRHK